MTVMSTTERVGKIIAEVLEGLAAPDDIVEYAVAVEALPVMQEDLEDGDTSEACDECGSHGLQTVISVALSLRCPEISAQASAFWMVPIAATYDPEFREHVKDSWMNLTFKRQAQALDEGLLASPGDIPQP